MSRSGYSDDLDPLDLGRWRGQVASAIRGKRGQVFLRDLAEALDAMPDKRLIRNDLEADGQVCAIGALGRARALDMSRLDPNDGETVGAAFGIPHQLAQEVVFENDEQGWNETPEERWTRMREWVAAHLKPAIAKATIS